MREDAYRIVLCEDEPLLLQSLRNKVEKAGEGYVVSGLAANGEEALALLAEISADVLITDIRMPIMDGMALLRRVHDEGLGVHCILLSGYSDFEYARTAMRLGAVDYLLKPVGEDALRQVLSSLRIRLDAQKSAYRAATLAPGARQVEETLSLMREFIRRHALQSINFQQLAATLNYSPAHLTRLFTRCYGESPQHYQSQLRINEAKHLLRRHRERSVRQIALSLGYEDPGYFARVFKQATGKSPQQFRDTYPTNE